MLRKIVSLAVILSFVFSNLTPSLSYPDTLRRQQSLEVETRTNTIANLQKDLQGQSGTSKLPPLDLKDPFKGPGAQSVFEPINRKVEQARTLLFSNPTKARKLLQEAVASYDWLTRTSAIDAEPSDTAKHNLAIAQPLLTRAELIILSKKPVKKWEVEDFDVVENVAEGYEAGDLVTLNITHNLFKRILQLDEKQLAKIAESWGELFDEHNNIERTLKTVTLIVKNPQTGKRISRDELDQIRDKLNNLRTVGSEDFSVGLLNAMWKTVAAIEQEPTVVAQAHLAQAPIKDFATSGRTGKDLGGPEATNPITNQAIKDWIEQGKVVKLRLRDHVFYIPTFIPYYTPGKSNDFSRENVLKRPFLGSVEIATLRAYLNQLGINIDEVTIAIVKGQAMVNPTGDDKFSIVQAGEREKIIYIGEYLLRDMLSKRMGDDPHAVKIFTHDVKHLTDPEAALAEHDTQDYKNLVKEVSIRCEELTAIAKGPTTPQYFADGEQVNFGTWEYVPGTGDAQIRQKANHTIIVQRQPDGRFAIFSSGLPTITERKATTIAQAPKTSSTPATQSGKESLATSTIQGGRGVGITIMAEVIEEIIGDADDPMKQPAGGGEKSQPTQAPKDFPETPADTPTGIGPAMDTGSSGGGADIDTAINYLRESLEINVLSDYSLTDTVKFRIKELTEVALGPNIPPQRLPEVIDLLEKISLKFEGDSLYYEKIKGRPYAHSPLAFRQEYDRLWNSNRQEDRNKAETMLAMERAAPDAARGASIYEACQSAISEINSGMRDAVRKLPTKEFATTGLTGKTPTGVGPAMDTGSPGGGVPSIFAPVNVKVYDAAMELRVRNNPAPAIELLNEAIREYEDILRNSVQGSDQYITARDSLDIAQKMLIDAKFILLISETSVEQWEISDFNLAQDEITNNPTGHPLYKRDMFNGLSAWIQQIDEEKLSKAAARPMSDEYLNIVMALKTIGLIVENEQLSVILDQGKLHSLSLKIGGLLKNDKANFGEGFLTEARKTVARINHLTAQAETFPHGGSTNAPKGVGPAMDDGSSGGKAAEAVSTPAEHKLSRSTPFIAGNWKMEKGTKEEAITLLREIAEKVKDTTGAEIVISPSPIHLIVVADALRELEASGEITAARIKIAAQNVSGVEKGAQTGRTGILQLKDAGTTYVIIGHSEQRRDKSNKINEVEKAAINAKVKLALANGLIPILCVGESLEEREAGQATNIVESMVKEDLEGLSAEDMRKVVIAYEPVWAIGTNKNATPEQAQEMNAFVRKLVETIYSPEAASQIIILYGGSVKPDNAQALYAQPDIDGFLIGGASLKADSFVSIAHSAVEENNLQNITNLMGKASSVLKIEDARETVLGSFGLTQDTLKDDSTAYVFSTAAVFDGTGLGALIPALANRGVQIAVVVKEGNTAQDKVIAQLNSAITDSENKLMIYESVKEAVDDLRDNNGFEKITYVATSEEAPEGELLNVDKVIRVEQILKSLGKITTLQEILGDFKSACEVIGTRV